MSYRKLEIWQKARALVIDIHKMTLSELPPFELYEEGGQIRRSIKSTKLTRPLKNVQFCSSPRKAKILTANIH